MKKTIKLIFVLLIVAVVCCGYIKVEFSGSVYATGSDITQEELEKELENGVEDQLNQIDFSGLNNFVSNLTSGEKSFFGSFSFVEKVKELLSGEIGSDYNSIFSVIISMLMDGCLKYLPLLAAIIAIAVLSSILNGVRPLQNKGIGNVVHFVCFGAIIILLTKVCIDFIQGTVATIGLIQTESQAVFPILLTLIAAMGGSVTVKFFQPIVLIISNIILNLVSSILIPILVLIFVFTILGNLTKVVKFDKFAGFLTSTFKWIIGFVFTIFTAFLTIKGIMASTYDGISIKTAKYAVKSYIPLLGGYLSDGLDIILTSSLLIKNAVGAAGILMLIATIIVPVINLVIFNLFLKLAAGICEPICDERISNFLYGISKIIPYLIVCILAAAFMYILTLGFAMLTATILL